MGNRIRVYRQSRQLSCAQLGLAVGLTRSYVSKLELRKTPPNGRVMFLLARFFGKSVEELFLCSESETEAEVGSEREADLPTLGATVNGGGLI